MILSEPFYIIRLLPRVEVVKLMATRSADMTLLPAWVDTTWRAGTRPETNQKDTTSNELSFRYLLFKLSIDSLFTLVAVHVFKVILLARHHVEFFIHLVLCASIFLSEWILRLHCMGHSGNCGHWHRSTHHHWLPHHLLLLHHLLLHWVHHRLSHHLLLLHLLLLHHCLLLVRIHWLSVHF